jgi:multicomponent Na+:H+ antiporter subunit E
MSPIRPDGSRKPSRYRAVQPWAIAWLTLLWVTLWGDITPTLVLGGVAVSVIMAVTFPLPPLDFGVKVRPLRLVALVARFLVDVIRASIQVTRVVLRRRPVRNAVVAVDLASDSDFILTGVAAMLSLVPGSVVVEARRSTHTLFLHVLDVPDRLAAESFRVQALEVERRFMSAFEPVHAPEADERAGGAR